MRLGKKKDEAEFLEPRRKMMILSSIHCRKSPNIEKLKLVVSTESRGSSETEKSWLLRPSFSDESRDSDISEAFEREWENDDISLSAPLLAPYDDIPGRGCLCLPRFNRDRKSPRVRVQKQKKTVESKISTAPEKARHSQQSSPKFQKLPAELNTISMSSLMKSKLHLNEQRSEDNLSFRWDTTDDEMSTGSDGSSEQLHIGNYATVVWCQGFDRRCRRSRDDEFSEDASGRQLSTLYEEDEETETDTTCDQHTLKDDNTHQQQQQQVEKEKDQKHEQPEKLVEYLNRDESNTVCSGISRMSSVALSISDEFEEVWANAGDEKIEITEHKIDSSMPGSKVDQVLASLWSQANERGQTKLGESYQPRDQRNPDNEEGLGFERDRQPRRDSMQTTESAGSIFTEGVASISIANEAPVSVLKNEVVGRITNHEQEGDIMNHEDHLETRHNEGANVENDVGTSNAHELYLEHEEVAKIVTPPSLEEKEIVDTNETCPTTTVQDDTTSNFYPIPSTDSDSVGESLDQSLLHKHRQPKTPKKKSFERQGSFWMPNLTRRSLRGCTRSIKSQPCPDDEAPETLKQDAKSLAKNYKQLAEDKDELWYYRPIKSFPSIEDLPNTVWRGGEWRLLVDVDSIEVEAVTESLLGPC